MSPLLEASLAQFAAQLLFWARRDLRRLKKTILTIPEEYKRRDEFEEITVIKLDDLETYFRGLLLP